MKQPVRIGGRPVGARADVKFGRRTARGAEAQRRRGVVGQWASGSERRVGRGASGRVLIWEETLLSVLSVRLKSDVDSADLPP